MPGLKYCAVLVCFLDASDPIYEQFSLLGRGLRDHDVELIVCSLGDASSYDGFTAIPVPFALWEHGARFSRAVSATGLPLTGATLRELVTLEQEWTGAAAGPSSSLELLIQKACVFWGEAIEILKPCAVLSWGSTAPFSRLMTRLSQALNIPNYIIERGWFGNTLSFENTGQGPFNKSVTQLSFVDIDEPETFDAGRWSEIEAYYRSLSPVRRPDSIPVVEAGAVPNPVSTPSRKVLFLGSNDAGAGYQFRGFQGSERYASWIHSSQEACGQVAAALATFDDDVELWYKCHPGVQFSLDHGLAGSKPVQRFETQDIASLVQAADVIVTLGSSTQLFGYIYEKPVVVLGNSYMMGRDVDYPVFSSDGLKQALEDALAGRDFAGKLGRGRAVICGMYDRSFIGLSDDTPCRYGLADLTIFLSRLKTLAKPQNWSGAFATFEELRAIAIGEGSLIGLKQELARLEVETAERLAIVEPLQANAAGLREQLEIERQALADLAAEMADERAGWAREQANALQIQDSADARIAELTALVLSGDNALAKLREDATGTISALTVELSGVRAELAGLQSEAATQRAAADQHIATLKSQIHTTRADLVRAQEDAARDSAMADERIVEFAALLTTTQAALAAVRSEAALEKQAFEVRVGELQKRLSASEKEAGRVGRDIAKERLAFEGRTAEFATLMANMQEALADARDQAARERSDLESRAGRLQDRIASSEKERAKAEHDAALERKRLEEQIAEFASLLAAAQDALSAVRSDASRQRSDFEERESLLQERIAIGETERGRVERDAALERKLLEERIAEFASLLAVTQDSLAVVRDDAARERVYFEDQAAQLRERLTADDQERTRIQREAADERATFEARIAETTRETWTVRDQLGQAWAALGAERATTARLEGRVIHLEGELSRAQEAAVSERALLEGQLTAAIKEGWALNQKLSEAWASLDAALETARLDGYAAEARAEQAYQDQQAAHSAEIQALQVQHDEERERLNELLTRYRNADAKDYVRWTVKRAGRP